MRKIISLITLTIITAPYAQERTATGAAETQMSWSTLSNQITGINTKVDAVISRVDQSVLCGSTGLIYSPGASDADANGCVEAKTNKETLNAINNNTTRVNNIVACNAQGLIFNGTSCIQPATGGRWLTTYSTSAPPDPRTINTCPSNFVTFGPCATVGSTCKITGLGIAAGSAHEQMVIASEYKCI